MRDCHRRRTNFFKLIIVLATLGCVGAQIVDGGRAAAQDSFSFDPQQLDFGDQVIKKKSPPKRVTVMNAGGRALYVDSAAIEGDSWRDFSIAKDTCTGMNIDPGKACVVDVVFTPSQKDQRSARLKFISGASDSPQTLKLIGNGLNSVDISPL